MSLLILPFYEPESGTWCYLIGDKESGRAAIIDPIWVYDPVSGHADTGFSEGILAEAASHGWQLDYVLETHVHADHLSSAGFIQSQTGARIGIGRGVRSVQGNFKRMFNLPGFSDDGSQFDLLFADGDSIQLGSQKIRVIDTPGHTSDSITYLVDDAAFIGDTLFAPEMGSARCDFPGGNAGQLYDSIQKLYALPSETRLFLCHDYPAEGAQPRSSVTVRESMQENIHIMETTLRDDYIQIRMTRDAGLGLPKLILPALQVNIRGGRAPETEENNAAYLKIPFNQSIADLLGS